MKKATLDDAAPSTEKSLHIPTVSDAGYHHQIPRPAIEEKNEEVARVRLPLSVTALASLGEILSEQFGKDLSAKGQGKWMVFERPKMDN